MNHRFIPGPTHDECWAEGEDGRCLASQFDRIHFPPGDDSDESYAKLEEYLRFAEWYWDDEDA